MRMKSAPRGGAAEQPRGDRAPGRTKFLVLSPETPGNAKVPEALTSVCGSLVALCINDEKAKGIMGCIVDDHKGQREADVSV